MGAISASMESGLHEIFFDFAFASNPQKIYEVPDFLIDVQKPDVISLNLYTKITLVAIGFMAGFVVARLSRSKTIYL